MAVERTGAVAGMGSYMAAGNQPVDILGTKKLGHAVDLALVGQLDAPIAYELLEYIRKTNFCYLGLVGLSSLEVAVVCPGFLALLVVVVEHIASEECCCLNKEVGYR
jgi:hypothetical protein